jgi:hypothetical protein
MDVVHLPVYLETDRTPIAAALATLKQVSCGALLIRGETLRLIFAGDLLRARALGIINVQSVQESKPVGALGAEEVVEHQIDFRKPFDFRRQIETVLASRNLDYALPPPASADDPATVMILTRSETLALSLRMDGGYECDGRPRHYFPEPRVTAGEPCPEYPICSRTDGRIPTVHPAV